MPERDEAPPPDLPRGPTPLEVSAFTLKSEQAKRWAKKYRTEIAASSSSLLSTLSAYPLDSVKTRMQAYKFNGFVDCVRHTYRTEGVHGFWRGAFTAQTSMA